MKRTVLSLAILCFLFVQACSLLSRNYTLAVAVVPVESGEVEPDGGVYRAGTEVALTATPSPGFEFARWEDDSADNLGAELRKHGSSVGRRAATGSRILEPFGRGVAPQSFRLV